MNFKNFNRTQCILIGKLKDNYSNVCKINVINDSVRCLGFFLWDMTEKNILI